MDTIYSTSKCRVAKIPLQGMAPPVDRAFQSCLMSMQARQVSSGGEEDGCHESPWEFGPRKKALYKKDNDSEIKWNRILS
jgi:hypothetical protein